MYKIIKQKILLFSRIYFLYLMKIVPFKSVSCYFWFNSYDQNLQLPSPLALQDELRMALVDFRSKVHSEQVASHTEIRYVQASNHSDLLYLE